MSITIFPIYKSIIIRKVLITCIIRRIDINDINLPCMGITKSCKGFEVIAFNKNMVWSLSVIAEMARSGTSTSTGCSLTILCSASSGLSSQTKPYFFCERSSLINSDFSSFVRPSNSFIFFASSYLFIRITTLHPFAHPQSR